MFVKKMPIFQGFLSLEAVKKLSITACKTELSSPVFYDIETTGLARYSTFLYLAGAVYYEEKHWQMCQWIAENPEEEASVLRAFSDFMTKFTCAIQYNGDRFDQPYLESRLKIHNLPSPFARVTSLDLYQKLKPLKGLLKLSGMKQEQMEGFLGMEARKFCPGRQCIRLYQNYLDTREEKLLEEVMGHNREDLLGLGRLFEMLGYLCLLNGEYVCSSASFTNDTLLCNLTLPFALPADFSNTDGEYGIHGGGRNVVLSAKANAGKLRQYYSNYKEYDYIPSEDTAMPKSLTRFMERSLRRPATKETCYTWFSCSDLFLSNPQMQMQYLGHTLAHLADSLK